MMRVWYDAALTKPPRSDAYSFGESIVVLVVTNIGEMFTAHYDYDLAMWFTTRNVAVWCVTHWQHLPMPPEDFW